MSGKDQLIAWLNDAYAMEKSMEETLERHAKDAKGAPDVQTRIERHIEETRLQAEIVKGCIEGLGGKVSGTKSALAGFSGAVQGMMNKASSDTMVKNSLSDYAAEHFEIASYKALIEAARDLGEETVAQKLTQILHQEEEMARFLEQKLPSAVRGTLAEAAS
ncbi:DUF892 family protein [Nocardiopsis algeriensis]|uniref:Ferritin-like metal-binding protein YciE n=1 Tax=Nocardiopsis algeriensis TaxID=1478215 RepID=A0A841IQK6_9ACTN|nr:ferritin-like metal-binding protein YciE [Nocardiopsis algeriensis]